MSMNSVQLIGNLGADPEIQHFENGKCKAKMTLYVNRIPRKGQDAEVDRFNLEAWGNTAEFAKNYLTKGSRIAVTGSLRENRWESPEGKPRSRIYVLVNQLENLSAKNGVDRSAKSNDEDPDF